VCFQDRQVITREYILKEFVEHYVGKFKATREQAGAVADVLRGQSVVVVPIDIPADAFEDVDDLPVLGTAVAGRADALVTGDRSLIQLGHFRHVRILSPRVLHDLLVD